MPKSTSNIKILSLIFIIGLFLGFIIYSETVRKANKEERQKICQSYNVPRRAGGCDKGAPTYCRIICYKDSYSKSGFSEAGCSCGY